VQIKGEVQKKSAASTRDRANLLPLGMKADPPPPRPAFRRFFCFYHLSIRVLFSVRYSRALFFLLIFLSARRIAAYKSIDQN